MASNHNRPPTLAGTGPTRFTMADGTDRTGFTLVEVIVVLVLLALIAALAAPAFLLPETEDPSALGSIVSGVQDLSARRGETLKLQLASDGEWRVESTQSRTEGVLAEGRLESDFQGPAFTLVVSPLGTCGFDIRSTAASRFIPIDPLTCKVGLP